MAAPKRGRKAPGAKGRPWRSLALILLVMAGLFGGMFLSGHKTPRLGIDLAGGTSITLEAKNQPGKPNAINKTNMDTAVSIIERRVNGLGVQEAEVQTQGDRHIIVNIPKGTNSKQAREQVGTTAELGFRPVLTLAQTGQQQPTPTPSPSDSTGSGKKKDGQDGKGDKSGEKGAGGADDKASSSGSSSSAGQGRAVTEGLKSQTAKTKETPTPKASESGSKKSPPPTTPPQQQQPPGVSGALAKKLQALNCNTKESRAKASEKAAAAKPSQQIVACDAREKIKYALGPVAVQGKNVKDAKAVFDQQRAQWIVQMSFDDKGSDQFGNITGKLMKQQQPLNQFAIALDGEVQSAPTVNQRLTNNAEISGSFTQESAEDLGNILSYGALPLSFDESDVTTVTAALGSDQLHAGLVAGAIGMALVIIYLVAYYRGLSLIAILSLLVSAVLTYTIMTLLGPAMGFALNLPAVCGAIVAIGITADSFIVYFERIRDEVREGRTLRPAVERAWPRARRTILVSDFVSFLAAAVLFAVTVGKVQGFAFTLGLTTALDVVVVFFFTKPIMTLLARRKFFSDGHPWSGLDPTRLGAKPPLRRGRRSSVSTDTKEA
ncbi:MULTISPECIES: protein translocase subunit SecD [unclassified Streptomyces]|uniref:protein translocase subunit SecD n=1 Tax=unclassified Streptomyces TaxID=2593676 RepID=UPI002DDA9EC7|nr:MULTISPECIES: protein translocase subunit SecD [unclassified Streptomyces]WSA96297.1 protein translocase subunit SecD [Streptomyces sp. NBC_01795]WSB80711.1 protein translocase subunit SecD [Streptomyces sp. NBC_01775]WSS11080.1 protein translocase subunit SecD [Streptomyces sp. NBC_01186]WSS39788.1 protein translocase subunit SecD [Streptomyces sp. NBC_01187]